MHRMSRTACRPPTWRDDPQAVDPLVTVGFDLDLDELARR
jgi:hypothetical protein